MVLVAHTFCTRLWGHLAAGISIGICFGTSSTCIGEGSGSLSYKECLKSHYCLLETWLRCLFLDHLCSPNSRCSSLSQIVANQGWSSTMLTSFHCVASKFQESRLCKTPMHGQPVWCKTLQKSMVQPFASANDHFGSTCTQCMAGECIVCK